VQFDGSTCRGFARPTGTWTFREGDVLKLGENIGQHLIFFFWIIFVIYTSKSVPYSATSAFGFGPAADCNVFSSWFTFFPWFVRRHFINRPLNN
jgi:hypothetical protein